MQSRALSPRRAQHAVVLATVKTEPSAALKRAGLDRRLRAPALEASGRGEGMAPPGPNKRIVIKGNGA